jgi:hypothetical protein
MKKEKILLASDLKLRSDYIVDYVMNKDKSEKCKDYLKEITMDLINWTAENSDYKVGMFCRCPKCNRFPTITYKKEHDDLSDPFCADRMKITIACSNEYTAEHNMPYCSIVVRYNHNDPEKLYENYIQKAEMDLIKLWNDNCAIEKLKDSKENKNEQN